MTALWTLLQTLFNHSLPYLNVVVRMIAYGLLLFGMWSISENWRKGMVRRLSYRIGKRQLQPSFHEERLAEEKKEKRQWEQSLGSMLVSVSARGDKEEQVQTFKRKSLALALVFFIAVAFGLRSVQLSIFSFMAGLSLPYLMLLFRLHRLRVSRANQIRTLVDLLLTSYRLERGNIYHAFRSTASSLERMKSPLAIPVLQLLSSLQSFRSERETWEALQDFVFSIDTSLAQHLGAILATAVISGLPIEEQLQHLSQEISGLEQLFDDEKADRGDNLFLAFSPILLFPLIEFFLYYESGTKFYALQFGGKGADYFIAAIIAMVVGIAVGVVIMRPKMDI